MNLIFSTVFEQDFAEIITRFAKEASVEIATRFEENTYRLIDLLTNNPELGRLRKDLNPPDIRSFRIRGFDSYLLFYRIQGDDLIILRLRHAGMNLQALFVAFE